MASLLCFHLTPDLPRHSVFAISQEDKRRLGRDKSQSCALHLSLRSVFAIFAEKRAFMPTSESKTRNVLIEVARNLFAQKGKKNVTMNDIAKSSGKGRRTLYLYFKSKDDIYKAVIQTEVQTLDNQLTEIYNKQLPPRAKLTEFITAHLEGAKAAVLRNGSLRSDFFRDIYEVEKARRKLDAKEIKMIADILSSGNNRIQNPHIDIELSATILFYAVKGLEIPYMRKTMEPDFEQHKKTIIEFVLESVRF